MPRVPLTSAGCRYFTELTIQSARFLEFLEQTLMLGANFVENSKIIEQEY